MHEPTASSNSMKDEKPVPYGEFLEFLNRKMEAQVVWIDGWGPAIQYRPATNKASVGTENL